MNIKHLNNKGKVIALLLMISVLGKYAYSSEIKQNAGFGKEGEKGFEGTITNLQHRMYLCVRDFRQKRIKKK